ncbi:hypothetical protein NSU_3077 [Novosphingobium pentaromativorans US6-1]|uniref:Uncharacterized protein n=1 Tax=Novosphingobium pentaromativorans US6-1 TaxID=1088721 RepID=G6EFF6_9SPHN|nr:hypothetical protein NSU_3077 [Novosphingobium pentaromativorans US6-1]
MRGCQMPMKFMVAIPEPQHAAMNTLVNQAPWERARAMKQE